MLQGSSYKLWCKAILLLNGLCAQLHAENAPAFLWAKQFAGTNSVGLIRFNGHCMDELGNSYLTGRLQGDMHFDGQILLSGSGSIFIVKLDRGGNVVWARRDGGTNSQGYAIARSTGGQIYVFARVGVTPATIAGQTITSNIPGHTVMAKYTSQGEGLWARTIASGSAAVEPSGMVVHRSGAIYWTARVSQSPITIGSTNITHTGWSSPVIVKCDSEGAVAWVKAIRGWITNGITIGEPAIDKNANLYVCGDFTGIADFGSTNLTTPGDVQIYVAKYNADGDVLWARQAGGPGPDAARRNTLDASGNFIVSGSFSNSATFGSTTISNSVAAFAYVVASYNPDGDVQWARPMFEGTARTGVASDSAGNVYFAADCFTNVSFAKLDAAGELKWTRTVATPNHLLPLTWLHADAMGHCYASGELLEPSAAFDGHVLTYSRAGNSDAWIAKLDTTSGPTLRIQPVGGAVAVSWPVLAEGFHLEWSTNATGSWFSNEAPAVLLTNAYTTTVPITGESRFFRLRR